MYFFHYAYMMYPYDNLHQQIYNQHPLQIQHSFPPVNTDKLYVSAERFQALIKEARLLTEKIINDPEFAHELMNAAQLSDQDKVDNLIMSTGISIKANAYFSPSGIQIEFDSTEQGESCCKLDMRLTW